MKNSATRRLNQGVSIVFSAFIFISICSYWSVSNQRAARKNVVNSQSALSIMNRISLDIESLETSYRGFVLTKNDLFLKPFESVSRTIPNKINEISDFLEPSDPQRSRLDSIEYLAVARITKLKKLIDISSAGESRASLVEQEDSLEIDEYTGLINRFISFESNRLDDKIQNLDSSMLLSSIIIGIAGVISLLITLGFYIQLRKDIINRAILESELKHKDKIITKKIRVTQDMASKVANGDYTVRILDEGDDELSNLTTSLNEMASSLEVAFRKIKDSEWKQSGLALLNVSLQGNKSPEAVAYSALTSLIEHCSCINGAFYVFEAGYLKLQSCYGFETYMQNSYEIGEGIVGQTYLDHKIKVFYDAHFVANCTNGSIALKHVFILPLLFDEECIGVIELGSLRAFTDLDQRFLIQTSKTIALELMSALSRAQVQLLLEETQAQSEELQSQHTELENLNTMLEAHAQQLQISEEELKVQQEELLQSNQVLEEQSKKLEEKNEIVANRNLEIQKKVEELALTTKYKSDFMANMSHELRTPLNSILLLSRLMIENAANNLSKDQIESAMVIESSGISLMNLIDEILDLSKIEAGKMKLDYQSVSVRNVVSNIEMMFTSICLEKGLDFIVEINSNVPEFIEIDHLRLEQILRNFLSNAIKFTANGFVRLDVYLDDVNHKVIHFAVQDSGIGIALNDQELIFDAFQQADGSTRRQFGGTGLGLSISLEIAKLFSGEIQVYSELNLGSTFVLSIPVRRNYAIEPLVYEDSIRSSSSVKSENVSYDTTSLLSTSIPEMIPDDRFDIIKGDKVILIVEDDTSFAKVLIEFANKNGFKVVLIVRGDLAVQAAEEFRPLAILLDIQLPIKDGWQVMGELKNNQNTAHIPVHMMSSFDNHKGRDIQGVIDFIEKPFALDKMGDIFDKINLALKHTLQKVLIVEDNAKHASALMYFLSNNNINCEIKNTVPDAIKLLLSDNSRCVILNMGKPNEIDYDALVDIKCTEGLAGLPIIVFTAEKITTIDELKINKSIDSIIYKTAHSFQRVLDEVGLFLHLVHESSTHKDTVVQSLGKLEDVLKDKTVLIADDDVRNIFTLSKVFEQYNMNVISALNGKEALLKLRDNVDISIVLMDIMMPEMDGYECILEIRKNVHYLHLPIIAVTAKAMIGDREKCIEVGASDYISKPIDKNQLLSLMRVWLY